MAWSLRDANIVYDTTTQPWSSMFVDSSDAFRQDRRSGLAPSFAEGHANSLAIGCCR